jgi:protein TonB
MNTSVAERRPLGALGRMGIVAGLHAGALYLIASSLGLVPSLVAPPPIDTVIIDEVQVRDPTPVDVKPRMQDPQLSMERPEVPQIEQPDSPPLGGQIVDDPPLITEIDPPTRQSVLLAVRHDARHPLTQPAYPAKDIREGNEGSVELEVYVLPTGRIGDVRVLKSTGSPTLDQSAMDEARRRWRMLPATRDGEPYAQWHRLKVTFSLKDR